MNYLLLIMTLMLIYSLLALSLNLQVGYTGLLSLSQAAFYGIGAYIFSLLMLGTGMNFFPAMILAVIGTMILSFIIALPSLKLIGDYYMLASLGFQTIVFVVLYNWIEVTNGHYGLRDLPRPVILGSEIDSISKYFTFTLIVCSLCAVLIFFISRSPYGRTLKAIREESLAAEALGKPVFRIKVSITLVAAGFAAVAGTLFAGYSRFLDPTTFTLDESIFILSAVIIGGSGTFLGPIVGVLLLFLLLEVLRSLGIPDASNANIRQIIYGISIILLMRFRSQGLLGEFKF